MIINSTIEKDLNKLAITGDDFLIKIRLMELRHLALNSSNSLFIFEFINTFPEFANAIRTGFADFNSMDLKFCALLKLGFSTVEIANITNSSMRAAESRKYRIRKRLGLETPSDLYEFMGTLGQDSMHIRNSANVA